MQKRVSPGVRCRIIGSQQETDTFEACRAVIGEGPNVGVEVTVIEWRGESPTLGHIWRVDAGAPKITLFWGHVASEADVAESLLEVIDEPQDGVRLCVSDEQEHILNS